MNGILQSGCIRLRFLVCDHFVGRLNNPYLGVFMCSERLETNCVLQVGQELRPMCDQSNVRKNFCRADLIVATI